jgi:pimeloyl-ACP methyl ester carboxylesterase
MTTSLRLVWIFLSSTLAFTPSGRFYSKSVTNTQLLHPYSSPSSLSSINSSSQLNQSQLQSDDKYFDNDPSTDITIHTYKHKQWNLSYLYKPPSPGNESKPPIIFIHPIGVGLSSWFWTKVMKEYGSSYDNSNNDTNDNNQDQGNPPMYAIDLIGCGLENGADKWDPNEKGLFFPLSWVEGVETFIQKLALNSCTVVVQGGLAGVGISLSSRNPISTISKLILTSPPTYDDMINPVPQKELETNYNFLTNKLWGNLAFTILESRAAIKLFSNLFLFSEECDEEWLDYTMNGASYQDARTPVQVFNAGFVNHRSFEEEMVSLDQQVLIVSGTDDKRDSERVMYATNMKNCDRRAIDGTNVMPWENPRGTVALLKEFLRT